MTYIQNHTLIGGLRDYARALRDMQGKLEARTESEATRQVAKHFNATHDFIKEVLDRLDEDMSESAAKTFNQYTPDTHPLEDLQNHSPMPEKAEDLIPWTLARQNHMVEWCEHLSRKSISPRTTSLFGEIAEQIRELSRKLASDTKAYEQDRLHS